MPGMHQAASACAFVQNMQFSSMPNILLYGSHAHYPFRRTYDFWKVPRGLRGWSPRAHTAAQLGLPAVTGLVYVDRKTNVDSGQRTTSCSTTSAASSAELELENFIHAPSTDLSREVIKFLVGVILAQATEVFLEKCRDEKKTNVLVSQVASQVASMYTALSEEVKEFMGKGIFDRNWVTVLQLQSKAKYFTSVMHYYIREHARAATEVVERALETLGIGAAPPPPFHWYLVLTRHTALNHRLEPAKPSLHTKRIQRATHLACGALGHLDLATHELRLLLRVDARGLVHAERDEPDEQVPSDDLLHLGRAVHLLDRHDRRRADLVDRGQRLRGRQRRVVDQVVVALRLRAPLADEPENGGAFYVEVFGRKFERELEALRRELAEANSFVLVAAFGGLSHRIATSNIPNLLQQLLLPDRGLYIQSHRSEDPVGVFLGDGPQRALVGSLVRLDMDPAVLRALFREHLAEVQADSYLLVCAIVPNRPCTIS
ncbi:BRO1-domain-containing protein [Dentipellis sp. KUC8613]|nr:BRO1-domain-containing protein [Dentipellis sp. KUC8613]